MRWRWLALIGFILLATVSCSDTASGPLPMPNTGLAPVGPAVTRVDLGTLGGRSSFAADIDNAGVVVGWSDDAQGVSRAFRWSEGSGMTDLGTLPGDDWSRAVSIKDNGAILGVSGRNGNAAGAPVLWSCRGDIIALPIPLLPGAQFGAPSDFNTRGDVVGWDVTAVQHPWFWNQSSGKVDLALAAPESRHEGVASAVSAEGVTVGSINSSMCHQNADCWHAFLWSASSGYRDLGMPGGDSDAVVTGLAMNARGVVAGWTIGPAGQRPYRWRDGAGFEVLAAAGSAYALGVSDDGWAVGAAFDAVAGVFRATAWSPAGAMMSLSPDDVNASVAVAVNGHDIATGWAAQGDGSIHAILWQPARGAATVRALVRVAVPVVAAPVGLPIVCLGDPRALISRASLFACVAQHQ